RVHLPGARGAVREFHPSAHDSPLGSARGRRGDYLALRLRAEHEHLLADRAHHAHRARHEELDSDRGVREPASRPWAGGDGGGRRSFQDPAPPDSHDLLRDDLRSAAPGDGPWGRSRIASPARRRGGRRAPLLDLPDAPSRSGRLPDSRAVHARPGAGDRSRRERGARAPARRTQRTPGGTDPNGRASRPARRHSQDRLTPGRPKTLAGPSPPGQDSGPIPIVPSRGESMVATVEHHSHDPVPSHWPIITAIGVGLIPVGIVASAHGWKGGLAVIAAGLFVALSGAGRWWGELLRDKFFGRDAVEADSRLKRMFAFFIASEAMIFGA